MSKKVICEKCGSEMGYFMGNPTCGWFCPTCGNAVVTSYIEPVYSDVTVYTIRLNAQSPSNDAVKAAAKAFCCNFLEAKRVLEEGSLQISDNALVIKEKAALLQKGNVSFCIEPDFPYPYT